MVKKILFTGGGTVGHVTLNLILIPKFLKDGWEVHYIGDKHGIEYEQILKSNLNVTFHAISTGKLRRYFSLQNMIDVFKVGLGILQSIAVIIKVRPNLLFSKGGFVSVPPVIASKCLGVPVFIHESDLSMGLANRIAYKFATIMYSTFEQPNSLVKVKQVGAVTKINNDEKISQESIKNILEYFDTDRKTLLFIGGSAGAKIFNDFVAQTPQLLEDYNVINISGDKSLNTLSQNLYRIDYVTDTYQSLVDLADIVVTRGGSNTIFELLAMKKIQIIVPLGKEASRGDQLENAAYFEKRGYAKTILESQLTYVYLQEVIQEVLSDEESYRKIISETKELQTPEAFYKLLNEDIKKVVKGN